MILQYNIFVQKLCTVVLISLLVIGTVFAQEEEIGTQLITNTLEEFLESNDVEDFDYNTVFENLQQYYDKPININDITEDQLKELFVVSEIQISNFLLYRAEFGEFLALQELQAVPEWDLNTINAVRPFLMCQSDQSILQGLGFRDAVSNGKSTLFLKGKRVLQERQGFQERSDGTKPYIGDPNHLYVRYRFDAGQNLRAGFTAEKDPGERLFGDGAKYGFDFYSFFLYGQNISKRIKAITLGDYAVSLGQGLILHNDFGTGKTSYVMNVKKSGRSLRPYSSVNEANFFRGVGIILQPSPKVQTTLFASYKNIDASVFKDTVENTDFDEFTSFRQDGFHRTPLEIINKGALNMINMGGKAQYKTKNFALSLNGLYTQLDKSLVRDEDLYQRYLFAGDKLLNASIDYQYRRKNATFFGESAMSDNGAMGHLHGVLTSLDRRVDMSVVYRNYAKDYQVLNANAFAESSQPINENGVYLGMELRPVNRVTVSTYMDFWKNPWASFRRDGPGQGHEFLLKVLYTIKRKLDVYAQYRIENKQINSSFVEPLDYPISTKLQRLRIHMAYKVTKEWEWRSRIEWAFFDNQEGVASKGNIIYQDIIYKPIAKPYSFNMRYALFDVESFDTRIYAYENDLLYEFYIPFFQNRGSRFYVNARYKPTRSMTIEGRYGVTIMDALETISSGNSEIQGNTMSEVKMQIRYSF